MSEVELGSVPQGGGQIPPSRHGGHLLHGARPRHSCQGLGKASFEPWRSLPLSKPEVAMGDEDASTGSSWNLTVLFRTLDKACFLDLFARLDIDSKAVTQGLAATLRSERTPMVSPLDRGVRQHSGWAEKLPHCQGPCPRLGCHPRFTLHVGPCSAASECARGQPVQVWLVRVGNFGEFAYRSYA